MAGDKNKNVIWALLLSLLALITTFQQNYHNNQLEVTPNEVAIIAIISHLEQPTTIFVWFVPSTRTFLAKAVKCKDPPCIRIFLPLS